MPITVNLPDGRRINFPDGMPPEQIQAAVQQLAQAPAAPTQAPQPQSAPAAGMLPTAGAFGGSLLGTIGGIPGRIAGAGIGGALGKGAEMFMDEKDDSFMDSLAAMGTEGVKQAGMEAAGGLAGKLLKAGAVKLADAAINPIESVARKYPNIGETYTKVGKLILPSKRGGVGAVGKKSSTTQAAALRTESRKASDAMLEAADKAGAQPIDLRKTLGDLRPILRNAATDVKAGKADARPELLDRVRAYVQQGKTGFTAAPPGAKTVTRKTPWGTVVPGGHPAAFVRTPPAHSLSGANVLRRRLDDAADKAFKAAREGQAVNTSEATVDKALASGLRRRIKEGAEAAGQKNYGATVTRTGDLAGLTKALDKASTRKHLLTRTLGISTGITGGVLGGVAGQGDLNATLGGGAGALGAAYLLTNPRNLGRMALGAKNLGTAANLSPQMLRLALLAQLSSEQPPTQ